MEIYLVEHDTLGKLVDMLLSKKYQSHLPQGADEIREQNIRKLDNRISADLFSKLSDDEQDKLNDLFEINETNPAVFQNFFKNIGIDLEAEVATSMRNFSMEFLGGSYAE